MKVLLAFLLFAVSIIPAAAWEHDVKVNPMTDTKSCGVTSDNYNSKPPIFVFFADEISILQTANLYPGKPISIRIDKNPAITTREKRFSPENTVEIINQIKNNADVMLLLIYEWPKDTPTLHKIKLKGITEHLDACIMEMSTL